MGSDGAFDPRGVDGIRHPPCSHSIRNWQVCDIFLFSGHISFPGRLNNFYNVSSMVPLCPGGVGVGVGLCSDWVGLL
jgi:hypothetical protein